MQSSKIQEIGTTVYGKPNMLCFPTYVYRFDLWQSAGIRVFLQQYNYLQTPGVASLCRCERNY